MAEEPVVPDFDETFDFSPIVTGLNSQKTTLNAQITAINARLSLFGQASDYSAITAATVSGLNDNLTRLNAQVASIDAVLAEITAITSLDDADKGSLAYFYSIVLPPKADFMMRSMFNYQSALADTTIVTLRDDAVTPVEAKTEVAKILYNNYSINRDHISTILSFAQYSQL